MGAEKTKYSIMAVAETESCVWFIELAYEEADGGHAVGSVYVSPAKDQPGQVPRQSLATNDSLSTIWASSSGSVWVGSADGRIATTAAVQWPPVGSDVIYKSKDPSVPWTATALPPVRGTGTPPNVTALWGTDDQHVFAGTYLGHIYFWNGQQWTQIHQGQVKGGGTIKAFDGSSSTDVFAVADNGVILHFDGNTWQQQTILGDSNGNESFTGIHALPDGHVVISANGRQGRLVHGTRDGLTELTRTPLQLTALVGLGERILLATGDGVAELFGMEVRMVKSNFHTVTAWPGRGRVFFVEPTQGVPSYIQHDPRSEDRPWIRRKH